MKKKTTKTHHLVLGAVGKQLVVDSSATFVNGHFGMPVSHAGNPTIFQPFHHCPIDPNNRSVPVRDV